MMAARLRPAGRSALWLSLTFLAVVLLLSRQQGRADASSGGQRVAAFSLGVAVGDVSATGARLWARADSPGNVTAQVATDAAFNNVVWQQETMATAATDFTVQLQADTLSPGHDYFYRWLDSQGSSRIGRFRTAPAAGTAASVRLVFTGDSNGTDVGGQPILNRFEVLDAARLDEPDFFAYIGDTVYADATVRVGGPAVTLADYRQVYRTNRQIEALPDLLAATSLVAIWDDHEVRNDFSGETVDPDLFNHGRQAFLEYMPLIEPAAGPLDPTCAGPPLFRQFSWGSEIDVIVLDERSCRSALATDACPWLSLLGLGRAPDPFPTLSPEGREQISALLPPPLTLSPEPPPGCLAALADPDRTMLGPTQLAQFKQALKDSTARFKFVVNEVTIQELLVGPYDRWEGYAAERQEILNFIADEQIENVIFLSADIHANIMNQVYVAAGAKSLPVAYEVAVGPIAAATLQHEVAGPFGQDVMALLQGYLTDLGVECRQLNAFAYGLVEVDAAAGTATISIRDETGQVLADQLDSSTLCQITLPQVAAKTAFLPLVIR